MLETLAKELGREHQALVEYPLRQFVNDLTVSAVLLGLALAGYGAFKRDGYARGAGHGDVAGPPRAGGHQQQTEPDHQGEQPGGQLRPGLLRGGDKSPQAVPWDAGQPAVTGVSKAQVASWRVQWQNYCEYLLLIEERMSEFVEFTEVPLQLVKNKRKTEAQIAELERRLGLGD